MSYACPFCYKEVPLTYEPSYWLCCGKIGRAIPVPEEPDDSVDETNYDPYSGCDIFPDVDHI